MNNTTNFMWLDEVGNLIQAVGVGTTSYAGRYRLIYFPGFKALAVKTGGNWKIINRVVPNYIRGCYAAAQYLKI